MRGRNTAARTATMGGLLFILSTCVATTNNETETNKPSAEPAEKAAPAEPRGLSREPGKVVAGTGTCSGDADCVPGECCHPRTCVAKAHAPSCESVPCTLSCIGGTMDCGGRCLCDNGKCAAEIPGPFILPEPKGE